MVRNVSRLTPQNLAMQIGEAVATDSPMPRAVTLSLELGHPLSKEIRRLILMKIGERLVVHTAPIGRDVGAWDIDEAVDGERLYVLGDWDEDSRREYAMQIVWNQDANGIEPDSFQISSGAQSDTCTLETLNEFMTRYAE